MGARLFTVFHSSCSWELSRHTPTRFIQSIQECQYWSSVWISTREIPLPLAVHQDGGGRYVIQMSDEAKNLDTAFYNEVEALHAQGGRYEPTGMCHQLSHSIAYFEGLEHIDAKSLHSAWSVVVFLRICDDIRRFLIPTFLSFMIYWMNSKSYTLPINLPTLKYCFWILFIELMNSLKSFPEVRLLTPALSFLRVESLFLWSN